MFSRLSVTLKGVVAFGFLALVGAATSGIVLRDVSALKTVVEETTHAAELVSKVDAFGRGINEEALVVKSFLLTGNRDYVAEIERISNEIDANSDNLRITAGPEFDGALDAIDKALVAWRDGFVSRQIQLMRRADTVDLAKAIEAGGEGARLEEAVEAEVLKLRTILEESRAELTQRQGETLDFLLTAAAIGLATLIGFALIIGYSNYRLVSRPLSRLSDATLRLANGDLAVEIREAGRGDEIGAMAKALEIFRGELQRNAELEAENERSRADAEVRKRAELNEFARAFESSVMAIAEEIVTSTGRLNEGAGRLAELASGTTRDAVAVSRATEQATANVQTVASATEELSASIREINEQIRGAADIAGTTASEARRSGTAIDRLSTVVDRISEVTGLINAIAEQTNLLALNATIEAARAGEAGRGFAVVASEVKQLASQTAKATEEIGREIGEMKSAASVSVEATRSITGMIESIAERAAAMASAAEQQTAATANIAQNVAEAAAGTGEVSRAIIEVSQSASQTGNVGDEMRAATAALYQRSGELQRTVGDFLNRIRAA